MQIVVLDYNIDTNVIRTEEGYARDTHPLWRANARGPQISQVIQRLIKEKNPDIVHVQECRKFKTKFGDLVDSVTPCVDAIEALGYVAIVQSYNPLGGDYAFKYVTGYDPKRLKLTSSSLRYWTKTPDKATVRPDTKGKSAAEVAEIEKTIKEKNFGPIWERGVFITRFKHVDLAEPIHAFNVHLDIAESHRLAAANMMTEFVGDELVQAPDARIVITGDFNTFSDWGGPKQLAIIGAVQASDGSQLLQEATEHLHLADGRETDSTFYAFPYDLFDIKREHVPGAIESLDSVEDRASATAAFAALDNPSFNLVALLAQLIPALRLQLIDRLFEKCKVRGSKLDRAFYRGFASGKAELLPATTRPADGLDFNDADQLRKFILDKDHAGPAFVSDHQPLIVTLSLP